MLVIIAILYNLLERYTVSGPLPNADNFFVVADTHLDNIYQVDATTGVTGQLLPFGVATTPRALTYDPTDKLIYWADSHAHTINRYSLVTINDTEIYRDRSNAGKDIKLIVSSDSGQVVLANVTFARNIIYNLATF